MCRNDADLTVAGPRIHAVKPQPNRSHDRIDAETAAMACRFWVGVALATAGLTLAMSPALSAVASSGSPAPILVAAPSTSPGAVLAGVTVQGRPWAGRPQG